MWDVRGGWTSGFLLRRSSFFPSSMVSDDGEDDMVVAYFFICISFQMGEFIFAKTVNITGIQQEMLLLGCV